MTFESLLSPHSVAAFLKDTMGQSAFYIEGSSQKFLDLVDWKAVNHLLECGGLDYPRLRLYVGDQELAASEYSRTSRNGYNQLLVPRVTRALRNGATLMIGAIEELSPPVARLCRAIENKLEISAQADLYASWRKGPFSARNWNDHEAIILQVEGSRRWRLNCPTLLYPSTHSQPPEPSEDPVWDRVLGAGEALYVPRGWWFCDEPAEEPTLYLVVTFRNPTALDVVRRLVTRLGDIDLMRMDYPRFGSPEQQSLFLSIIQAELARECATPGLLLGFLKENRAHSEPRVRFNLPWDAISGALPPSNDYLVVPLLRFPRRDAVIDFEREIAIGILMNGELIRFPEDAAPVIDRLLVDTPPSLAEMLEFFEDKIPRTRLLEILSALAKHGIISFQLPQADNANLPSVC